MSSTTLLIIFIVAAGVIMLYEIVQIIRIEVLKKKCDKLISAIDRCLADTNGVNEISLSDVKVDDRVLNDISAWRYTDLIPPDKFEKIKKYIK